MGGPTRINQSISFGLSILLIFTVGPGAATSMAYQSTATPPAGSTAPSYPGQGVPATADELQSLVAPIALYPDALVAQILSCGNFSRPGGRRQLLGTAEQDPDGKRSKDGR